MNKNDLYPVLFACILLVKGANRSILCDVQRLEFIYIPNELIDVFSNLGKASYEQILMKHGEAFEGQLPEIFDYFEENEYLFFTPYPDRFPKMSMQWDEPTIISNSILDYSGKIESKEFQNIIKQLTELKCKHLQIRIFDNSNSSDLESLMTEFSESTLLSVELIFPHHKNLELNYLQKLCADNPEIFQIVVTDSPESKEFQTPDSRKGNIFFTSQKITNSKACGVISTDYFSINVKTFTEAQLHNTCLNRKISIDQNGEIKNCPSLPKSYGNIKDTTLKEALEHPDFKKYWNINKDQIEVCRDCEFRYICTDCRAYLEEPENIYSKPLKCGYNPYTAEWEEWSTNPLKQKAIDFYGMRELVTDAQFPPDSSNPD